MRLYCTRISSATIGGERSESLPNMRELVITKRRDDHSRMETLEQGMQDETAVGAPPKRKNQGSSMAVPSA
jgi:hypothetical protein